EEGLALRREERLDERLVPAAEEPRGIEPARVVALDAGRAQRLEEAALGPARRAIDEREPLPILEHRRAHTEERFDPGDLTGEAQARGEVLEHRVARGEHGVL